LCDAAIQLLADEGAKGLSHPKVDRYAGVPNGSTSFYFRTRSALLRATAERVAELDLVDLTAVAEGVEDFSASSPSRLASMVMMTAHEPRRSRAKARFELMLAATRDRELSEIFRHNNEVFTELHRREILARMPEGTQADPDLLNEQTTATMHFVGGVHMGLVGGDGSIDTAEKLDRMLTGIANGIAALYQRRR
jgi:DNA-binding transcriptional regulator YbjK